MPKSTATLLIPSIVFFLIFLAAACDEEADTPLPSDELRLNTARLGTESILSNNPAVPSADEITLFFNVPIDPATAGVFLFDASNSPVNIEIELADNNRVIRIDVQVSMIEGDSFTLVISDGLRGASGEPFDGAELPFSIAITPLKIFEVSVEDIVLDADERNLNVPIEPIFELRLSHPVSASAISDNVVLSGDESYDLTVEDIGDTTYRLSTSEVLPDLTKVNLRIRSGLGDDVNRPFEEIMYEMYTHVDTTPDFPVIPDEELLTLVQEQTFKYFWDFGHPVSGLARERNTSGDLVTIGGSGFGLMSIIVGVERGFVTRDEALDRWETIFNFLKDDADRFHGAWSHWLSGTTGEVRPFSMRDDGGDLVETAFLVQGMITVRQYLDETIQREAELRSLIDTLWYGVEWDWYQRGGQNVLYWHWSPNFGWEMNLPIRGHNETQIIYTLAAASPTHGIDLEVYDEGYARSGDMRNGTTHYGIELPLGRNRGGPLFFAHYSYLGMDPRNLKGPYADYWEQNIAHSLINRAYCIDNPNNFVGYSADCWGLTASDGNTGYSAHSPSNDRGVITPTAAISSIPYTPEESLDAIRHFYYFLGDRLWGEYGFYDAFNPTTGWVASSYLAIDQGPIICMIENYRTGLLWDLYMSAPEVRDGLDKLGFTY